MAKKKTKRSYYRRSPEEIIKALEAQIEELRSQIKESEKFSPEAVYEDRQRLELSAADYAALVGVSMVTIYKWEKGDSKPRASQLEKWLAVRGMKKSKAWAQLGY